MTGEIRPNFCSLPPSPSLPQPFFSSSHPLSLSLSPAPTPPPNMKGDPRLRGMCRGISNLGNPNRLWVGGTRRTCLPSPFTSCFQFANLPKSTRRLAMLCLHDSPSTGSTPPPLGVNVTRRHHWGFCRTLNLLRQTAKTSKTFQRCRLPSAHLYGNFQLAKEFPICACKPLDLTELRWSLTWV